MTPVWSLMKCRNILHLHIRMLTFESAPLFDLRVYYRVNLQPKDDESRVPFCHNWFMEEAFVLSDTIIHNYFLRVFYHDFIIRYQLRDQIPNLIVYFSAMTRPYLRSIIFFSSSLIAGYFFTPFFFFLYLRDQLFFGIYSRFFSFFSPSFFASLFWHVTIFSNFSFTLGWKFSFYSILNTFQ